MERENEVNELGQRSDQTIAELEAYIARLEVKVVRWRALAVAAMRAWDSDAISLNPIIEQIREESTR